MVAGILVGSLGGDGRENFVNYRRVFRNRRDELKLCDVT